MADTKISALTASTTPLAGTEVLPIVQSGTTVKVSVANLTAGRAVTMLSNTMVSASAVNDVDKTGGASYAYRVKGNDQANVRFRFENTGGQTFEWVGGNPGASNSGFCLLDVTAGAKRIYVDASGNVEFNTGNAVFGTAAKGVNFTANTPAAGMTSQLLNWYEEGSWTPTQGGGLTVVGAFSSTGRYTRIGRQVTVSGTVTGATSVAVTAAGIITTNLPFTVVTAGHGNATNAAVNASTAVICTTTNVTSASAIAATGTITFSATYFV